MFKWGEFKDRRVVAMKNFVEAVRKDQQRNKFAELLGIRCILRRMWESFCKLRNKTIKKNRTQWLIFRVQQRFRTY